MKFNTITVFLSLTILCFGQNNSSSIKSKLEKIKWLESTPESKGFVSEFPSVLDSLDVLDFRRELVIYQANTSGNIDLISLVRKDFESEDWDKERTWEEGLEVSGRYQTGIEVLGKWNSAAKTKFKGCFLNAPDVPYQRITSWYVGYLWRGLQGNFLESMAKNNIKDFKEVIDLLSDEAVSLSKKRTIVWAMRYDHSGYSEVVLKSELPIQAGVPKPDIEESVKVLERKNNL